MFTPAFTLYIKDGKFGAGAGVRGGGGRGVHVWGVGVGVGGSIGS